jgi:hypothetical protein
MLRRKRKQKKWRRECKEGRGRMTAEGKKDLNEK